MHTDSSPQQHMGSRTRNVGGLERMACVLAGSALVGLSLVRRSRSRLALAATGGTLIYRGIGGRCAIYQALGINRAARSEGQVGNLGVKVEREFQFDASPQTLYAFWRDLRNLPRVMRHLESVECWSDHRSRWRVKGPVGTRFEWDADIINDEPNHLIAWQTAPGARVMHAGSVRFEPRQGGGTLLQVSLQYHPPGGELSHIVARMLGEDPGRRIEEDLASLKAEVDRVEEGGVLLQSASADAPRYRH